MDRPDRATGVARAVLRATLLVVVTLWATDVPGLLGRAYYTEQYLALVAGLCTAMVLAEGLPGMRSWARIANGLFTFLVLGLFLYVALRYPDLQLELAMAPPSAVALGILLIVGILEATRRRTGPFLPILLVVMMALTFVGPHLPASFQTRPVSFSRLIVYLGLDTNALFSKILAIASIIVVPFIVFGYLLNDFGGSAFFSGLATRLVGRFKGGPAKVSVVGSAIFGMVSGSAVANVVAVGSVSIPMMARAGYPRPVAAAIEAVSSTGGQLMPPIMGASAFLMAELLELPYRDVATAAILPALFFYLALFLAVDFEARRLDVAADPAARLGLPGSTEVAGGWVREAHFLIPVGLLIYLLFWENQTAEYAGLLSTVALAAVHLLFPLGGHARRAKQTVRALVTSMGAIPDIVLLGAAAGLIIGVLNITGISFAITMQMLVVSNHILGVLLALTAILSLILGLGMPTVGVYVLLATLAAPALVELGVPELAAHMYVLYFGMLSMITPPIAIACFAAATVAGVSPWKTSFAAVKVGAAVYLVPVAFVLQPELLFLGTWGATVVAMVRLTVAVALLTAAVLGHAARPLSKPLRVAAAALALANILPLGLLGMNALLGAASVAGLGVLGFAAWPRRNLARPVAGKKVSALGPQA